MKYGLGWKKEIDKSEDHVFEGSFLALKVDSVPFSISLDDLVVDVLNQGELGSCVANSVTQALRMGHVRQGVKNPQLASRLMLYYLSRAKDHTLPLDSGTYLRTAFEMLNKFGFCPESYWEYSDDGEKYNKMPPTKAFWAAYDQRSPVSYKKIKSNGQAKLNAIRSALSLKHPVCFGVMVSNDFCNGNFDPSLPLEMPRESETAGGHAMLFMGYEGDKFQVLNSWGNDFGNNGRIWFSSDYALNCEDCWIVEHSPVEGEV